VLLTWKRDIFSVSDWIAHFSDDLDRWAGRAGQWAEIHWPWILVIAVGLGLFLALLAPICVALGLESVARPIYWLYSHICHQRPERTLWVAGHPMAFCARDVGVYGGIWLGMVIFSIRSRQYLSGKTLLLFSLPLILDGGTQLIGLRESTNLLRLTTGLLAGGAAALYLLPTVATHTTSQSDDICLLASDDTELSRPCQET